MRLTLVMIVGGVLVAVVIVAPSFVLGLGGAGLVLWAFVGGSNEK